VGQIDKTDLYRSQTPHGARRELLLAAYRRQDPRGETTFIDETTLVQAAGFAVRTVDGDPANLKVTLPGDEQLAMALLSSRAREEARDRDHGSAPGPQREVVEWSSTV
jgi:2-C-methyl-D-erythritol 4-phosphate cytidylyltransferase